MMYKILGNVSCYVYSYVKGRIMYLLANASLSKTFDIATSNFVDA